MTGQERRIARLRECLLLVRERLTQHPEYAALTEAEEEDVGGDTAEFSYLVREISDALDGPP